MERNRKIDALRGIAIFLVILVHSIIVFPINLHENKICLFLFEILSTIHMPLFFLVSGYCFSSKSDLKDFLIKKIKRLLLPYFAFNIIELIFRSIFSNLVNKQIDLKYYIKSVFLYGGEYWFLYALFLMLLLFYFMNKKNNNKLFDIVVLFVLFVLNIMGVKENIFCLNSICTYSVYFELGYLIRKYKFCSVLNNKDAIVLFISFIIWVALFLFNRNVESNLFEFLTVVVGLIFINYLTNYSFIVNKFSDIGKYSLQLYLLNGFLLVASRTLICKITSNPTIIVVFNFFINYYVSYLMVKYILNRNKLVRLIIGA